MDERCKNFRNFETKIRNIYRYIYELKPKEVDKKTDFRYPDDAKIRRKLEVTIEHITKRLERFELHLAVDEIYDFIWHEFADIYIEQSKKRREEAQPCLEYVFESSLKLLHPFMPFITEEIYQKLGGEGSLMVQKWPFDSGLRLSSAERPQGKPK